MEKIIEISLESDKFDSKEVITSIVDMLHTWRLTTKQKRPNVVVRLYFFNESECALEIKKYTRKKVASAIKSQALVGFDLDFGSVVLECNRSQTKSIVKKGRNFFWQYAPKNNNLCFIGTNL